MTPGRRAAVAVIAWVAVVATGSTVVWAVISRVGAGVIGTIDAAGSAASASAPTWTVFPGSRLSPRPDSRGSPPAPGASEGTPFPSGPDTSTPATPPAAPAPQSGTPSATPPGTEAATEPAAQPVRRSWQGEAGLVTVECRGARIRLIGAQPEAGYVADYRPRDVDELEVEFEATGDGDDVRVRALCAGGVPRFDVGGSGSG